MTLIEEIRNKCSPELLAERNSVAIAAKVSEGRKRIQQPTLIGDGDVTQAIGRPAGPMLADWLEQAANAPLPESPTLEQQAARAEIRQAWRKLSTGNLDIGSLTVREGIDGLVGASPLTQEQADVIKTLALVDDPVSEMDVRRAIWSDSGEWMV